MELLQDNHLPGSGHFTLVNVASMLDAACLLLLSSSPSSLTIPSCAQETKTQVLAGWVLAGRVMPERTVRTAERGLLELLLAPDLLGIFYASVSCPRLTSEVVGPMVPASQAGQGAAPGWSLAGACPWTGHLPT